MSGSLDANAVRQTIFHNPSLKNYHIIIFNQNQRNTKTNLPNFSNFTLLGPLEFTYCLEVGPGMASASSNALSITSSSTLLDSKGHRQTTSGGSPQCVTLPTLPPLPVQTQTRPSKTTAYCRKIARNVMAMATGEAPAEVATGELPEIVKAAQEAWEKVEDKYAVSSLGVAAVVALWGSTGMISAIDRLPLIPGVLELVGIGYTGWFAYKNLIFKPDREALVQKIKDTYKEIIGSS